MDLGILGIKEMNSGACIGGEEWIDCSENNTITSFNPSLGKEISQIQLAGSEEYAKIMESSLEAFKQWKMVPAPKRGDLVYQISLKLRENKDYLGSLISYEMGKIKTEGDGEVQEMIDLADFAVGLSRQLYGLTMPSERPGHRMQEMWNPLGVVGVVSAFNFPVAVWSWNFAIATVCGNATLWKPSPKTPLVSYACEAIFKKAVERSGIPQAQHILELVIGANEPAEWLADDKHINLVSLTLCLTLLMKQD
jgi:aldehyde dehydrogenase (NAD+)